MKYFTLSYSLTTQDYREYDSIYINELLKMKLKKSFLYLIPVVLCAFLDFSTAIIVAVMALLSFLLPIISCNEFSIRRNRSFVFDRETTVEFYDDHIVTYLLPCDKYKSQTQVHYGFDKVGRVLESEKNFYFMFKDNTMVIIPKRAVGEQEYTMIKNLIDNLFSNKYFFFQIYN